MTSIFHRLSVFLNNIMLGIKTELSAIFYDSGSLLLIVIALPLYTIIYSTAYGSEVVRDVAIAAIDQDNTPSSRRFINGLSSGPNTLVKCELRDVIEAKHLYFSGEIFGIVCIPHGFERKLLSGTQANIGIILDGSHLLLYRQVLEQVASNALTLGSNIEFMRLIGRGNSKIDAISTVEPVTLDVHHLYNRSLGYGSFVMPSVVMVIIQQTLVIGLAMMAARRRSKGLNIERYTTTLVIAKLLVYLAIYGVNLIIILFTIWPIFGFQFSSNIVDLAIFVALYITSVLSLGLAVAQLFKRREAPLMLLLCTSVPILLLAGVSYPHEAYSSWLYGIGRLLPSSCGVDGFIAIASRGATLDDVATEVVTLVTLSALYLTIALIINKHLLAKQQIINR